MSRKVAKKDKVGMIGENRCGSKMTLLEYNSSVSIVVKFTEHGNLVHTTWGQFCNGTIKNPYDRTVYGVGYLGEGDYEAHINGETSHQYSMWRSMLMRCYNNKYIEKYPSYKDASVCNEWHNFQNFAAWYDLNYYEVDGERMNLDKDILTKGRKIYSPETCVFVPARINNLFLKVEAKRGEYPVGVTFNKYAKKYESKCSVGNGVRIHLGYYDSPEESFQVYKAHKEKIIKEISEEYKERIPKKLYKALMDYRIEIGD